MLLFYPNRDTAALYYILFLLTSFLTNGSRNKKNEFHMKMKQHTYSEYTCHPLKILLLSCNNINGI